jgi:hypothetical protein
MPVMVIRRFYFMLTFDLYDKQTSRRYLYLLFRSKRAVITCQLVNLYSIRRPCRSAASCCSESAE